MLTLQNVREVTLRAIERYREHGKQIDAQLRFRNRFLHVTQLDYAATCRVSHDAALAMAREALHSLVTHDFVF